MKNVHLIATDKPSRLIGNVKGFYQNTENFTQNDLDFISAKFYNIYITDNSEIKEGDWCIVTPFGIYKFAKVIRFKKENGILYNLECKKIILTTDQDLIKDGIQAIDDKFLEWFVKNPGCEFVEVERWTDYKFENDKEVPFFKYKIILKNKQEHLTITKIKELVDQTKNLTPKEQTSVAYSLPITACALYVLQMKSKYEIKVSI